MALKNQEATEETESWDYVKLSLLRSSRRTPETHDRA
jgi:hypothetical protein